MKFVLDTSAVIYLVERKPDALIGELRKATEAPSINVVTLGELAVGWASLPSDSLRRQTYHAARRMRVVDIVADHLNSEPTALIASFGVCRKAGIKGNDAWIAATAHFSAAVLLTYDETLATRFATIGQSTLVSHSKVLGSTEVAGDGADELGSSWETRTLVPPLDNPSS